ncbi:astacin-like metalloendopeptidase [Spea bombifrons]|uniref:astacin-like metalloendopeptidase n=1 Tax=Spea bombifrons TaxID=233779 RepID=UPI00234ABA33|nr:astacin-like metalloendopeptidase [Spea bombifrons]
MELSTVLVLIAAGWAVCVASPVQVIPDSNSESVTDPNSDDRTVFERIEAMNKGISTPLQEGDIAYNIMRSTMKCNSCLWDISQNGMVYVPYVLSSAYSDIDKWLITDAIKEFETMTCVKFVSRSSEADYLSIESLPGCWSLVSKIGGKQVVSLNKNGCMSTGVIQHELMHTLGFIHEHSRSDRDNYVDILWQNILPVNQPNFVIRDSNNLDLPYDYGSVMHYPSTAFSNPSGRTTILPKPDPKVPIGQTSGMSHLDVMKINKLYKCNLCRTKFTDPSGSFSADGLSFGQDGSCLWLIQTPSKRVSLQLSGINIPLSVGCTESYIKVYDGPYKSDEVLLNNTCGFEMIPPLISSTNLMLVELVSSQEPALSRFSASYNNVTYGETFIKDNGIVISPWVRGYYPNNVDAVYSIIAPPGYKVSLTFSYFYMEDYLNCSKDYLIVTDGAATIAPALGKFCGMKLPPALVSSGNVMLLQFHSDDQKNSFGYMASYRFEFAASCERIDANDGHKSVLRASKLMHPGKANNWQKSVLRAAQLKYPGKANDGLTPVLRALQLTDPGKAKDGTKSILKAPQFKYDGKAKDGTGSVLKAPQFKYDGPLDPEEPMDIDIMCEEEPMDTSYAEGPESVAETLETGFKSLLQCDPVEKKTK